MLKLLPIGVQTLEELVNRNYIYVDKTKYVYDLITLGKTYFISRPRRFGKSLLCSTFEAIFRGQKELFKDLWIYDSDYDWEKYTVLHFNFGKIIRESPEALRKGIHETLEGMAMAYDILLPENMTIPGKLEYLVKKLSDGKKNSVVIIIDEYDKPIIDHITNLKIAEGNREVLRTFYETIKNLDEYLRFIFLTGISKFSRTSVFSVLNNLYDLSMDDSCATLLGYTQDELEHYFKDYLKKAFDVNDIEYEKGLQALKEWYNGYKFSKRGEKVYGPWSVMSFMKSKDFSNFWYKSGNPRFLFDLIKQDGISYLSEKDRRVSEVDFESFDIGNLPINVLLFQTGYLTIQSCHPRKNIYTLDYPNLEIRESFVEGLVRIISGVKTHSIIADAAIDMVDALHVNKLQDFTDAVYALFTHIPYPKQNANNEEYYQTMVFLVTALLGIHVEVEVITNIGRIDFVAKTDMYIYIVEFKINKSAKEALQQIEEKKYYEKFIRDGRKVVLFGINFSTEKRNVDGWISKEIK